MILCEHRGIRTIACPPFHPIEFIHAMYGREYKNVDSSCPVTSLRKTCTPKTNPVEVLKEKCGQSPTSCNITASNLWFGDSCGGVVKYLHVRYMCLYGIGKHKRHQIQKFENIHGEE